MANRKLRSVRSLSPEEQAAAFAQWLLYTTYSAAVAAGAPDNIAKRVAEEIGRYCDACLLPLTTRPSVNIRDIIEAIKAGPPGDAYSGYPEAIAIYLTMAVSNYANRSTSLSPWHKTGEKTSGLFQRQAIPIVWDYAEPNPFSNSSGSFHNLLNQMAKAIEGGASAVL